MHFPQLGKRTGQDRRLNFLKSLFCGGRARVAGLPPYLFEDVVPRDVFDVFIHNRANAFLFR